MTELDSDKTEFTLPTPSRSMRRVCAAATGVALSVTLASCGSSQTVTSQAAQPPAGTFNSAELLTRAAKAATIDKSSVHIHMKMAMGDQGDGSTDCDLLATKADFGLRCDVDITGSTPRKWRTEMVMIILRDAIYMMDKIHDGQGLLSNKPWVKYSLTADDPTAKGLRRMKAEMEHITDVTKLFPPGAKITGTKSEQVEGKETMRYDVATNLKEVLPNIDDPGKKADIQASVDQGMVLEKDTLWIDKDNLPVKESAVTMTTNSGDTITLEGTFSDWGKAIQITAPPADQVTEDPDHK